MRIERGAGESRLSALCWPEWAGSPKQRGCVCVRTRASESLLPSSNQRDVAKQLYADKDASEATPEVPAVAVTTGPREHEVCSGVWLTGLLCQGRDRQMHRRHAA